MHDNSAIAFGQDHSMMKFVGNAMSKHRALSSCGTPEFSIASLLCAASPQPAFIRFSNSDELPEAVSKRHRFSGHAGIISTISYVAKEE